MEERLEKIKNDTFAIIMRVRTLAKNAEKVGLYCDFSINLAKANAYIKIVKFSRTGEDEVLLFRSPFNIWTHGGAREFRNSIIEAERAVYNYASKHLNLEINMKHYLKENPDFLGTIHRAGLTLMDMEIDSGRRLLKFYDDLLELDEKTGKPKEHKGAFAFRLECCDSRSYFKRWQSYLHELSRRYEGMLFTEKTIEALRQFLNAEGAKFRNFEEITPVDWNFVDNYTGRPALAIGGGCQLTFTPVFGWYHMEEQSHE